jgi:RimJ/RimL family protein N-acetyltransferase
MTDREGRKPMDWNGVPPPARKVLEGQYARLEPLDPRRHQADLFRSSSVDGAEERFRYLFDKAPTDEADFAAWIEKASASIDPLFFAVIDKASGTAEGRQAFMRIDSGHGTIEIGSILWGPALSRQRTATEAFFLFASHAFDTLGYRRLEWKCDDRNAPSKRAALRFGFTFEGLFRQHMVVKGQSRDTAWFAIIDADWPKLSAALRAWLAPDNFDGDSQQRRRLEEFRA